MTKNLWTRLVLPLVLLSALALLINTYWPIDGFFVNLV